LSQTVEAHRYYSLTEKPIVIPTDARSSSQYTFGEEKLRAIVICQMSCLTAIGQDCVYKYTEPRQITKN
jgi:hypothetical protein